MDLYEENDGIEAELMEDLAPFLRATNELLQEEYEITV